MTPKANIIVDQNANNVFHYVSTDSNNNVSNLAGHTAYSQFRKSSSTSKYYTFNTSIQASNGIVTLNLSANAASMIPEGRYFYDCILIDNLGIHSKLVEGVVTVKPGYTKT